MFIKLPPPQPSIQKYDNSGNLKVVDSMDDYYDEYGGCIDGECLATMADSTTKKVKDLKKGDLVMSENGVAEIECVI